MSTSLRSGCCESEAGTQRHGARGDGPSRGGQAGLGPCPTGGREAGVALAVGGGGCRFKYELARLQAGRSQGQLQYLDANHLVIGVLEAGFGSRARSSSALLDRTNVPDALSNVSIL